MEITEIFLYTYNTAGLGAQFIACQCEVMLASLTCFTHIAASWITHRECRNLGHE